MAIKIPMSKARATWSALYFEKTENEDENKNIINAQAPLHQVSTDVFKRRRFTIFEPYKPEKSKCKRHPKNGLQQCFFNTHLRRTSYSAAQDQAPPQLLKPFQTPNT